jgi:hypothetical protein
MQSDRVRSACAFADFAVRPYHRDSRLVPRDACSSRDGHLGEDRKRSNIFSDKFYNVLAPRSESKVVFAYASIRE